MRNFEDSTLWRISAYERMRLERSSSAFAQLGENTMLPTTILADLRQLQSRREESDVLEVLAACLRHRQAALLCLHYEDVVWPITVFPAEMSYHSPRDVALAAADSLSQVKLLSCDAPGMRPPGHWMHERVGRMEHYRPLKPMLWNLALHGPRSMLLAEIGGHAAYRATLSKDSRPFAPGALGPAADAHVELFPRRHAGSPHCGKGSFQCCLRHCCYVASFAIVLSTGRLMYATCSLARSQGAINSQAGNSCPRLLIQEPA